MAQLDSSKYIFQKWFSQLVRLMQRPDSLTKGEKLSFFNIYRDSDPAAIQEILDKEFSGGADKEAFANLLLIIEMEIEAYIAEQYLINNKTLLEERVFKNNENISAEIRRLTSSDRVSELIIVGAGASPVTAIIAHRMLEIPIVCLEVDKSAADLSAQLIAKLEAQSRISVVNSDAAVFSYEGRSCGILIVGFVQNKDEVLRSIEKSVTYADVIIRKGSGVFEGIYPSVCNDYLSRCLRPRPVMDQRFKSLHIRFDRSEDR